MPEQQPLFPVVPDERRELQSFYDALAERFGLAPARVVISRRKLTGGHITLRAPAPHRHLGPPHAARPDRDAQARGRARLLFPHRRARRSPFAEILEDRAIVRREASARARDEGPHGIPGPARDRLPVRELPQRFPADPPLPEGHALRGVPPERAPRAPSARTPLEKIVTAGRPGVVASPDRTGRREGALLVAAAALLWSTGGLAIKWIPLAPLNIVFHRAWIASATLLLLLRPRRIRPTPAFFVACGTYAGMIITFVVATKWTTAANAIFLQDSGIVWVLIFSPLVAGEAIDRRDVAAVAACLGGMVLFFVGKISTHGEAGNAMSLLSGAFYAATVLLLRRLKGPASEWTAIVGNLAAALVSLAFAARPFDVPAKGDRAPRLSRRRPDRRGLFPFHPGPRKDPGGRGVDHLAARTDLQSDLGLPRSRRAPVGVRDPRRRGCFLRDRLANARDRRRAGGRGPEPGLKQTRSSSCQCAPPTSPWTTAENRSDARITRSRFTITIQDSVDSGIFEAGLSRTTAVSGRASRRGR